MLRPIEQARLPAIHVVITKHIGSITYTEFRKRALFSILAVLLAIAAAAIIWQSRVILLVLFAGFLGGLVLATLTSLVQNWFHIPRTIAFVVLLAGLGGAVVSAAWLRGPELIQQFGQLQVDLPAAAKRIYVLLAEHRWGRWVLDNTPQTGEWSAWITYAASGIGGALSILVSTLACMLLVTMASIYLAAEPGFYLQMIKRILPAPKWKKIDGCLQSVVHTLRCWLVSRLVSMTAIGIIVTAGLWLLGVRLAGTLGIIAALLTFIPNVGPFASALPAALIAFAISPTKGLLCIGLFCLAHFIEGNFVTPLADRHIVKLPPFLTLSVQLILAPVAGALGIALAAPLLAAILGVARALVPLRAVSSGQPPTNQTIWHHVRETGQQTS